MKIAKRAIIPKVESVWYSPSRPGTLIRPVRAEPSVRATAAPSIIRPFGANSFLFTAKGIHTMNIPIIIAVLAVTEPTALPDAISTLPSAVATIETIISGNVVAIETMVAPMMNFGTPSTSAIQLALSTNQSPPLMIKIKPTTKRATTIPIFAVSKKFDKNSIFNLSPFQISVCYILLLKTAYNT